MTEPSRCIKTGQVLIPSDELAELLKLAEHLPDPEGAGRPSTPEEMEHLARGVDSLFAQRTVEEKVSYLSNLPAEEAVAKLMRLEPQERTYLFRLLPFDRREALEQCSSDDSLVLISA